MDITKYDGFYPLPYDLELDGYPVYSPGGLAAIATDPEYARLLAGSMEIAKLGLELAEQRISEWHANARNFEIMEPKSLTLARALRKRAKEVTA